MQKEIDKTMNIATEFSKLIEKCINIAETLIVLSLAGIFAGGIGSFISSHSLGGVQNGIKGAAQMGISLLNIWSDYCRLAARFKEAQLSIQGIKVQLQSNQLCASIVQHEIDKGPDGRCFSQPLGCFDQLTGCLSFEGITNTMSEISDLLTDTQQIASDIGQNVETFGEGLTLFGSGTSGTAQMVIRQNNMPVGTYCNYAANKEISGGGIILPVPQCAGSRPNNQDFLTVDLIQRQYCNVPVVRVKQNGILIDEITTFPSQPLPIDGIKEPKTGVRWTFELFCFYDQASYEYADWDTLKDDHPLTITILPDVDDDCVCEGNNEGAPASGRGGGGGVTLKADSQSLSQPGDVTFTAEVTSDVTFNPPFVFRFDFNGDGDYTDSQDHVSGNIDDRRYSTTQRITETTKVNVLVEKVDTSGNPKYQVGTASIQITVGSGGGTPVSDTSCTSGGKTYECVVQSDCSDGTWTQGLCTQFKSDKWYSQSNGQWYEYNSQAPGRTSGNDIRCCVTNYPPQVSLTSPSDGSTVSGVVTIEGTVSDPEGNLNRLILWIDGNIKDDITYTATSSVSWSYNWDTTHETNSDHTLFLEAHDEISNNKAYSNTVIVTVDNIY
jgi:hypothetical protein